MATNGLSSRPIRLRKPKRATGRQANLCKHRRGLMPGLLFLLLVAPSRTFRMSLVAADPNRLDTYNTISRGGFFTQTWDVHQSKAKMRVRQVPGDGSCLFHAIYVALAYATNGTHPANDYDEMCRSAAVLRQTALDFLSSHPDRVISVTHHQDMRSRELLEMTAREMGLSIEQYLSRLRDPKEWGGGLEIVALANALERPIFLYELRPVGILFWSRFVFKKMVECGMPRFSPNKTLHILIADCNFPDCAPYFYNRAGNHFLALFPCEDVTIDLTIDRRLRGDLSYPSSQASSPALATSLSSPRPRGSENNPPYPQQPALRPPPAEIIDRSRVNPPRLEEEEGYLAGRRPSLRGRVLRRLQEKLVASIFRGGGVDRGDGSRRSGR